MSELKHFDVYPPQSPLVWRKPSLFFEHLLTVSFQSVSTTVSLIYNISNTRTQADKKANSASRFKMPCSFCYLFCKRPVGLNLQSPLTSSAPSSSLDSRLKLRCLISNLLRTLSPLGGLRSHKAQHKCGLT